MDYITILKLLSFYLLYPIFLILKYTGFVLLSIAAPFVNLARYGMQGCLWPLRFLTKFETLYIFIGVALLVGVVTGASLHYASTFLMTLMNLESRPDNDPRGRTMSSYRAGRRDKLQQKTRPPIIFPIVAPPKIDSTFKDEFARLREREAQSKSGSLLTSTILEEDDSSDVGF